PPADLGQLVPYLVDSRSDCVSGGGQRRSLSSLARTLLVARRRRCRPLPSRSVRSLALVLVLCVVACSGRQAEEASTTSTTSTTTTIATTTSTTEPPPPCPPAPYRLDYLPATVEPAESSEQLEDPDEFTSIGGTHVRIWVNIDGATAIA